LLRLAGWLRSDSGLPTGDVVSSDTRAWGVIEAPLVSQRLGLTGRPDYLVRERGNLVPIEVKSAAAPKNGPHLAQTARIWRMSYSLRLIAPWSPRCMASGRRMG